MEMKARWAREEEGKATSRKGHHSGEEEGWLWNRRGEQQARKYLMTRQKITRLNVDLVRAK